MNTQIQLRKTCFGTKAAAFLAALGLAALGSVTAHAQNILSNPNLDEIALTSQVNPCPVNWVVDAILSVSGGYFDGGDSEPWCNVSPPSDPNGYGFFFKPFSGDVSVEDLLTCSLYQDNPTTPNTKFTLSGYASCEANYSGLFNTNSPPPSTVFFVEFLDSTLTPIVTNSYDLVANGLPTGGPGSMALMTTPQFTAPAGTAWVRAGAKISNTYSTSGSQSFFVDSFDLEAVAPPGSPVITNQPADAVVPPNGTAVFSIGVQDPTGVSYQWLHAGTNISNGGPYSGANTATLTITGATAPTVGHYRCLASNASGAVYSSDAALAIQQLFFYPTVSLTGKIGDTYRVDYTDILNPPTWIPLSTNKLSTVPQLIIDTTSPNNNSRYYRSVFLY
jgi:hypothetical protein